MECEERTVIGTQTPLQALLEGLIADRELPAKDKRKRLKQVGVREGEGPISSPDGRYIKPLSSNVPSHLLIGHLCV